MNVVTINGKTIITQNTGNIVMTGDRILIDGKDVTPVDTKEITVNIEGNVESLDIAYAKSIEIKGNVHDVRSTSGNISVTGDVTGDVKSTSGDVRCGNVSGSVKTVSGDIKQR